MKRHIPNFITLLNLAAGVIAILLASQNLLDYAAYFVFIGIFFDFFDGFFARILKVKSELGLQLDSLADMVTSGVAPGIIMFQLILNAMEKGSITDFLNGSHSLSWIPFIAILIPMGAAYRLANFNIDSRQTNSFIGLPTPALSIFIVSLPLINKFSSYEWAMNLVKDSYFLMVTSILGSVLMNANLSLFSLKFNNYQFKENKNKIKYVFIILAIALIVLLKIIAIPLIIILYISMSIVQLFGKKTI